MTYEAVFKGWEKLDRSDLLVAYRKAKADVFFENSFPSAIKFADFEQDLLNTLDALLTKLRTDGGFAKNKDWLGDFRIVPKKLGMRPKPNAPQGHVHFSDANRAFESLLERQELTPAFRIVGDFPVEMHIISALWINMIGHKFDACLDDTAYGSRLRRIRTEGLASDEAKRPFHITAVGSFQPYYQPYQRWRSDGLKAIRGELEQERDVIAVSLDLRSFYHQIDPSFLESDFFFAEIGLKDDQALTSEELAFTLELSRFLTAWSRGASSFAGKLSRDCDTEFGGGLVIGLTASRIISNALLQRWDKLVQEKVTPVHYGRYVDDMFLVLRDPGNLTGMQDLMGTEFGTPTLALTEVDPPNCHRIRTPPTPPTSPTCASPAATSAAVAPMPSKILLRYAWPRATGSGPPFRRPSRRQLDELSGELGVRSCFLRHLR